MKGAGKKFVYKGLRLELGLGLEDVVHGRAALIGCQALGLISSTIQTPVLFTYLIIKVWTGGVTQW